jgi:hypothetical protein
LVKLRYFDNGRFPVKNGGAERVILRPNPKLLLAMARKAEEMKLPPVATTEEMGEVRTGPISETTP